MEAALFEFFAAAAGARIVASDVSEGIGNPG
jgi:hypothetical protein